MDILQPDMLLENSGVSHLQYRCIHPYITGP